MPRKWHVSRNAPYAIIVHHDCHTVKSKRGEFRAVHSYETARSGARRHPAGEGNVAAASQNQEALSARDAVGFMRWLGRNELPAQ